MSTRSREAHISGASGSGKSSLAGAGVLPAICEDEVDAVVTGWRSVIVTPAALAPERSAAGDLQAALLAEICGDAVLPEALTHGGSFEELLSAFRRSPQDAFSLQIRPALARASGSHDGTLRLLIVVDQLEELFTSKLIPGEQRAAFLSALEALARSGSVWIIATIRSDFYQHIEREPALVRMKSGGGQFDLQAPAVDDLRRIIEEPAASAGLQFEREPGSAKPLSDRILADIVSLDLLPMLQYVLRELYERRVDSVLTLDAYDRLGGVEGALSTRAEEAIKGLRPEARSALGTVLQSIVTMGQHAERGTEQASTEPGQHQHVRQWADLAMFPEGEPARELIDELVRERLFTTDNARVTVAHESLLRVWKRAADWVNDNHDLLLVRARISARMQDGLRVLERGPLLSAGRLYLRRNENAFSASERAFIRKSVRAARISRVAMQVVSSAVVAGLLLLFLLRGFEARAGELTAETERELIRKDYAGAERAAAKALLYSDTAERRTMLLRARAGGVKLFAAPESDSIADGPVVFSSDGTLRVAPDSRSHSLTIRDAVSGSLKWKIPLYSKDTPDVLAVSSPENGSRMVAIAGSGNGVSIWRLRPSGDRTLESVIPRRGDPHKLPRVTAMAFHSVEPLILLAEDDCSLSLWNYASPTAAVLLGSREKAHETDIHAVDFDRGGGFIASAGADFVMRLWRTADLRAHPLFPIGPVSERAHKDAIFAVKFSNDGRWIASAGYERLIRVWGVSEGFVSNEAQKLLRGHEGTVLALSFSDDGSLLVSGSADETARLWSVTGANLLATFPVGYGAVNSVGWQDSRKPMYFGGERGWRAWSTRRSEPATRLWNDGSTVQAIAHDPGGQYLAVAGDDGKVRLMGANYEAHLLETEVVDESINGLAVSSDGALLAAGGTSGMVHVWRRRGPWYSWEKVRSPSSDALRHNGGVWGLCFGPGGRWIASGNTADDDTDRRIRIWRTSDWRLQAESTPLDGSVYALACAEDGTRIVSGDGNGKVTSYYTATLKPVPGAEMIDDIAGGSRASVWSVAISRDPLGILSGSSDGHVHRWVPNDAEWTGHAAERHTQTSAKDAVINHTINSISYSKVAHLVAAGGDGNSVELYDESLERVLGLPGQDGTVWWVSFSRDGSQLAFGGLDGFIHVWNIDSVIRTLHSASVEELVAGSLRAIGGPPIELDWAAKTRELAGMLRGSPR